MTLKKMMMTMMMMTCQQRTQSQPDLTTIVDENEEKMKTMKVEAVQMRVGTAMRMIEMV
jgi:hypothetical protein